MQITRRSFQELCCGLTFDVHPHACTLALTFEAMFGSNTFTFHFMVYKQHRESVLTRRCSVPEWARCGLSSFKRTWWIKILLEIHKTFPYLNREKKYLSREEMDVLNEWWYSPPNSSRLLGSSKLKVKGDRMFSVAAPQTLEYYIDSHQVLPFFTVLCLFTFSDCALFLNVHCKQGGVVGIKLIVIRLWWF